MKTSRISRETQRVVTALTPPRITRHSRRAFSHSAQGDSGLEDAEQISTVGSPSTRADVTPAPRKRKRETTSTLAASIPVDTTPGRPSPRKAPKIEPEDGDEDASRSMARRQPAKRIKGPNGTVTVNPPTDWDKVYAITTEMRKRVVAAVDTMGCEEAAEEHASPRDKRLQTLVSLMLSSQTKDPVTFAAMRNLQQNLPGGFNLESLLEVEPTVLNSLINKVGFHNNKTKYIKNTAVILRDRFGGDIPDTIEGMISLPGVGPKMAYLCMSAAWGRDEGIGVDVHVHRITNLWGWHKTSTPEQTRAELESWLPRDKWHHINHLLVGFGQTICLPVVGAATNVTSPEVAVQAEGGEAGEQIGGVATAKIERDDVGIKVEMENDEVGWRDAKSYHKMATKSTRTTTTTRTGTHGQTHPPAPTPPPQSGTHGQTQHPPAPTPPPSPLLALPRELRYEVFEHVCHASASVTIVRYGPARITPTSLACVSRQIRHDYEYIRRRFEPHMDDITHINLKIRDFNLQLVPTYLRPHLPNQEGAIAGKKIRLLLELTNSFETSLCVLRGEHSRTLTDYQFSIAWNPDTFDHHYARQAMRKYFYSMKSEKPPGEADARLEAQFKLALDRQAECDERMRQIRTRKRRRIQ
ncbi:endonuclease III [Teratosphaeria destructans]|uniref:Endonuclease III homolog n=1 Tax=Teratosphaeria destructans TaxID=418781 RepID=A0A9W7SUJ0_9PEZI|nr:endonuclease III [Teratosphaeria destructans]